MAKRRSIALILMLVYAVLEVLGSSCSWYSIRGKAAEVLDSVYWSPMDSSITEVDGTVVVAKGDDQNTGRTKKVPVRTWERARELVADGGTIYIMSPCSSAELPENEEMRVLDGGTKHITIKSIYGTGKQEILDVEEGHSLCLKNITLSPFVEESSVSLLKETARVVIGENVSILNKGGFYVEGTMSDRFELQVNTGKQNWYVTYEQSPLVEGTVLARVPEEFTNAGEYFYPNLLQTSDKEWLLEQREKGILAFYEKVIYSDAIYVCDDGNDTNSGHSQEKPVKTMKRAVSLVQKELQGTGTICICGTYTISAKEVWDYGNNIDVVLTGTGEHDLIVEENGSLLIKSGKIKRQTNKATAAILSKGTLEIGTDAEMETISITTKKGTFKAEAGTYTYIVNEGAMVSLQNVTAIQIMNNEGTMEISGGSCSNGGRLAVSNNGTMEVNGGVFSGSGQVVTNKGFLRWNGGTLQAGGSEYGLVNQGGSLKLENGSILGSNGVSCQAGTMELNGMNMEISGNIKISSAITMLGNGGAKEYRLVLQDEKFSAESAVVTNVSDEGAAGRFTIVSDLYISAYNAMKKEILLYPVNSYYVDPEQGDDGNAGNLPGEALCHRRT